MSDFQYDEGEAEYYYQGEKEGEDQEGQQQQQQQQPKDDLEYENDESQQQKQQEFVRLRTLKEAPKVATFLHEQINKSNWKDLLTFLEELKKQEAKIIEQTLLTIDKKDTTPIHTIVWKAPRMLAKLMISMIPYHCRETLLLQQDSDGNTPLHLACANLDISKSTTNTDSPSFDASIIKILNIGAPDANEIANWQGDTPLHLLLTSPAFRTKLAPTNPNNQQSQQNLNNNTNMYKVEAAAEELLKQILENRTHAALYQNEMGLTLLHGATALGAHERVLMTLLRAAPSAAEMPDKSGMLPLHYVAACGRTTCMFAQNLTMMYPDAIYHQCKTGDTPLHLFISNAKKTIKSEDFALSRNTTRLVEILTGELGEGMDAVMGEPNSRQQPPGELPEQPQDLDPATLPKCPIVMQNRDSLTPLHCCALFNVSPMISRLLMKSKHAEIASMVLDANKATPLHLACASSVIGDTVEQIEVLGTRTTALSQDDQQRTPLHVVVENEKANRGAIKALAEISPKAAKILNGKGYMPLHVAIERNASEGVIKALLRVYPKASKMVLEQDDTILHLACRCNSSYGIIRALIKENPEMVAMRNRLGEIPLHLAAGSFSDVASNSASDGNNNNNNNNSNNDGNNGQENGDAPPSQIEALLYLLDVNIAGCMAMNNEESIPLHYAASTGTKEIVKVLIETEPKAVLSLNIRGDTPLDNAKHANNEHAIELLKDAFKELSRAVILGGNDSISSSHHRRSNSHSNHHRHSNINHSDKGNYSDYEEQSSHENRNNYDGSYVIEEQDSPFGRVDKKLLVGTKKKKDNESDTDGSQDYYVDVDENDSRDKKERKQKKEKSKRGSRSRSSSRRGDSVSRKELSESSHKKKDRRSSKRHSIQNILSVDGQGSETSLQISDLQNFRKNIEDSGGTASEEEQSIQLEDIKKPELRQYKSEEIKRTSTRSKHRSSSSKTEKRRTSPKRSVSSSSKHRDTSEKDSPKDKKSPSLSSSKHSKKSKRRSSTKVSVSLLDDSTRSPVASSSPSGGKQKLRLSTLQSSSGNPPLPFHTSGTASALPPKTPKSAKRSSAKLNIAVEASTPSRRATRSSSGNLRRMEKATRTAPGRSKSSAMVDDMLTDANSGSARRVSSRLVSSSPPGSPNLDIPQL